MTYTTRHFGPLSNSLGVNLTPAQREHMLRLFERVVADHTEIVNHAWGILYRFLVRTGDEAVRVAMQERPLQDVVGQVQRLDGMRVLQGQYAAVAPFVDLLRLGLGVLQQSTFLSLSLLTIADLDLLDLQGSLGTAIGVQYGTGYTTYRNSVHTNPQGYTPVFTNQSRWTQQFLITAKTMAANMLVHYELRFSEMMEKTVKHFTGNLHLSRARKTALGTFSLLPF